MNRPSALVSDGLPFEFDHFILVGQSPPLEQLISLSPSVDPVIVDPIGAGPRTNLYPMTRSVLTFPDN